MCARSRHIGRTGRLGHADDGDHNGQNGNDGTAAEPRCPLGDQSVRRRLRPTDGSRSSLVGPLDAVPKAQPMAP